MASLTIGQVAKKADVGVETIRFYEREGLLAPPARRGSGVGYRQYGQEAVERLLFIVRAKGLGFALSEIKELLRLHADQGAARSEVKRRAEEKAAAIAERIADLGRMQEALAKLIAACDGEGPLDGCPIIAALTCGRGLPVPDSRRDSGQGS
ncbi:MAG: heavy metal-responsive transcriptional regulator [Gemmataceae bacterium]|nr:heavy metal-responsive transcriptional regulator [Gemmataceae bacterium]